MNWTYRLWIDRNNDTEFSEDEKEYNENETVSLNWSELPLGFIKEITGLTIAEQKVFVIPQETDLNGDGINDETNQSILGFVEGDYANKSLKYDVLINEINGTGLYDIPSESLINPYPEVITSTDPNLPTNTTDNTTDNTVDNTSTTSNKSDNFENEQKIPGFSGFIGIFSLTIILHIHFKEKKKPLK